MSAKHTVPESVAILEPFVAAGVFGPSEVHLAATLVRLGERERQPVGSEPESVDPLVVLAAAVAARAPRSGHVCVELADVHRVVVDRVTGESEELVWPDAVSWGAALEESNLVADPSNAEVAPLRPLVWDGSRLYLQRLWRAESLVADALTERASAAGRSTSSHDDAGSDGSSRRGVGAMGADDALSLVFGTDPVSDPQHLAARRALDGHLAVLIGGPGTGKTHTVARLLAAAFLVDPSTRAALCAPTGKAAARMTEAVQSAIADLAVTIDDEETVGRLGSLEASTVHRLLGRSRHGAVRHDRSRPLPHDLVVVDETSMVDLPLMAQLLGALRPDARLVLVGDPDQLASVEAGTVLADLVAPAPTGETSAVADRVVRLERVHRFGEESGIASFAGAVRRGDIELALSVLDEGRSDLRWVRPEDAELLGGLRQRVVESALSIVTTCRSGDISGSLERAKRLKVLTAVRLGRFGLYEWSDLIEDGVAAQVRSLRSDGRRAVGRPLIVTRNDPMVKVSNGDTGVVSEMGDRRVLSIDTGAATPTPVPLARLDSVEPWWAMTIHKSQGSEFSTAVVCLPATDSPVLTRELLYTGATRARDELIVVASEQALRIAIARPASRASGLARRLRH